MSLKPGVKLGPYEVLSAVGAGGMGEVYRARDTRLDRVVALKVLHSRDIADPTVRQRLEHEARAVAALNHPHICTLFDIGHEDGIDYLVMEFLDGQTLESRVRQGPVPAVLVTAWARQLAQALAAAHAKGIVHRDLKPANLFLTVHDAVKILDFGIAKRSTGPAYADDATVLGLGSGEATRPGVFIGTAAYSAPEQLRGLPVDQRTDIFSFGAVLYELVTGRAPFARTNTVETMSAIISAPPPMLPTGVPQALASVITRCLAKNPADRFQSAKDLIEALAPGSSMASTAESTAVALRNLPSIAVLPFADLSQARDQEYFCDGMADELITALMALDGVRVASRTSAFQFKSRPEDVTDIGRRLRVSSVLEGSVRRAGNRLRVTVQLTDVSEGFQVWSQRYDRDLDDVFAVQDEIARAVVEKLKVDLGRTGSAPIVVPVTPDLEAYQQYLMGRHQLFKLTADGLARGMEALHRAVERQADFGEAHATLAYGYLLQGLFAMAPPREVMPLARSAAQHALLGNPNLAAGHLALATVRHWYDWDWAGAEASYAQAIALSPGDANIRFNYSEFLTTRGRCDEAVEEAQRAIALDPVSPIVGRSLLDALFGARRHADVVAHAERMIELEPAFFSTYWLLGLALAELGRTEEAVTALQRGRAFSHGDASMEAFLGAALARAGRRAEAEDILRALEARRATGYVSGTSIGLVYQWLGDIDAAIQWYQRALEERSGECVTWHTMPHFDPIRTDPRFAAIVEAVESGAVGAPT